ncbi:MAG: DUF6111 family protein [Rickettsiales bacterium]|nr:DUF6111 family protein [Rickettsiales bacterium]
MSLFLFRFWPVVLPLVIYVLWYGLTKRRALRKGETPPQFREGPWFWMIIACLSIAVLCFLYMSFTIEAQKGTYVPAHEEQGVLVPGHINPQDK